MAVGAVDDEAIGLEPGVRHRLTGVGGLDVHLPAEDLVVEGERLAGAALEVEVGTEMRFAHFATLLLVTSTGFGTSSALTDPSRGM